MKPARPRPIGDKELAHIYNDGNQAALTVISHASEDLRRAKDYEPGLKATVGTDGGRGSDISDPTGNAAQAAIEHGEDRTSFMYWRYTAALRLWQKASDHLLRCHAEINHRAAERPGRASKVWQCVNRNCGDDIILPDGQVPHQGRCGPCAVYRTKHDLDATPKVVAARRRQRKVKT